MESNSFHELIEESPNPIFRVGLDGIIQYANTACRPLFDYCGCEVGGECPPFLFEDTSRTRVEEVELQSSTYSIQINPCLDKGYISVFAKDITAQKQVENNLKESQTQYKLLVEEANDIIYWANNRGEFTYSNPVAHRILNMTGEEIKGKHFTYLIRDDWKERTKKFYEDQLSQGKAISYYEFPVIDSEGNELWLGQNVKIMETDGKIKGFHAVARDITERINMEKSLKEAKEKAEISLRTQEMFLANMSHEIRTPLSGILGMSKLLSKAKLSRKNLSYLSSISSTANHLLSIINDLLDFSKIESGKMELESTGFELSEIVKNVVTTAQYTSSEKNISIVNEMDDDLSDKVFLGDPVRIAQVLTNIVGNAVKFTEEGEVKLTSELIYSNDKKYGIRFIVRDTGIGIPKDKLQTIFESFKQADNETARKFGGTGLGLSISRQLIELIGGEIHVESEEGKGTTFSVEIELEKGDLGHIKTHNQQSIQYALNNVRVLLVEDNPVNQLYATSILENERAIVELAENGKEAVEKVQSDMYDVVLMDGQMPEMGGIEATGIIRKELRMDIPIIALTANALKGDRNKYLEAGLDDYISKPFNEEDLINAIGKVLKLTEKGVNISTTLQKSDFHREPNSAYDFTKLKMFFGDDQQMMDKMVNLFKEEIPKSISKLENHYLMQDHQGIKFIAHDMKSSVDLMGLKIVEDLGKLEDMAGEQIEMRDMEGLVMKVIGTCNQALAEL